MKTSEHSQEYIQDPIVLETLLNRPINDFIAKLGKHLKKFIYLIPLVGIPICFDSCIPGYILSEPVYVEHARPPQPSNFHIWIDGDWVYHPQAHAYVKKEGYWKKPAPNRTYVSGYWQTTQRGHSWSPGHWQNQRHKQNH